METQNAIIDIQYSGRDTVKVLEGIANLLIAIAVLLLAIFVQGFFF